MSWRRPRRSSIRQVITGVRVDGDLNVIGQYVAREVSNRNFRLEEFAPPPGQLPSAEEARARPSKLLDARLEMVGFTGRYRELVILSAWREIGGSAQPSAFLIAGAGGSGKTSPPFRPPAPGSSAPPYRRCG
jgi:hypothetical protein